MAPSLAQLRVWILAAYRTASASPASANQLQALAALGAESGTQDVVLRGLGGEELRKLIEGELHRGTGVGLAAVVAERTEGNPLHALEIARSLLRDGESLEADPTPEVSRKLVRGIQPLLARRLAALPSVTQGLLRAAATLGLWFDAEVLQSAESCSKRQLAQALAAAESAGLVAAVAGAGSSRIPCSPRRCMRSSPQSPMTPPPASTCASPRHWSDGARRSRSRSRITSCARGRG